MKIGRLNLELAFGLSSLAVIVRRCIADRVSRVIDRQGFLQAVEKERKVLRYRFSGKAHSPRDHGMSIRHKLLVA